MKKKNTEAASDKKQKIPFFKRSIGAKLSLILIIVLAVTLSVIGILNASLLAPFYQSNKEKRLKEAYRQITTLSSTADDLTDSLKEISLKDNIVITITDSDFQSVQYATGRDSERNIMRLFGYYTGLYTDKVEILEQNDDYVIQETDDQHISTTYLEMWGTLENGNLFLLQTPLQSITAAAKLSTLFYLIVGSIVTIISAVIIYLLIRSYTKPLRQLNSLSKQMANLDFDARYTGQTDDEIGQLGQSFNKMSDELAHTISELKSANVELQKDNEKKTQIDEVRREFLNNVTHELKTPIALIQGYAEGLKDNVAEDADSRDFYCDVIIDEAAKMNNMVKQLLTLNRLEFGNDVVEMERFDLTQLIAGVVRGMQVMIQDSGATVSFPYSDPLFVWGDEFKIEEVITNYLSNACHHVDGEKKIEITMTEDDDHVVTVSVFNTGRPIPEDSIDHVFEKFYKVDKARTRAYGGSGIGLSIVKAIMEGHRQKYGVTNYSNGVAFYFTIDSGTTPKYVPEETEAQDTTDID